MKIKVFKFEVLNPTSESEFTNANWAKNAKKRITSITDIEKAVNNFCTGKTIKDIKVNDVCAIPNVPGAYNIIWLYYTIMYDG